VQVAAAILEGLAIETVTAPGVEPVGLARLNQFPQESVVAVAVYVRSAPVLLVRLMF
jgi:hypothetical protein